MKTISCMAFALIFVLVDVSVSLAQQRAVSIDQEKAGIRKLFDDEAQAVNNFLHTHDVEGNLRFYAKEYFEIRDGKLDLCS